MDKRLCLTARTDVILLCSYITLFGFDSSYAPLVEGPHVNVNHRKDSLYIIIDIIKSV